MSTLLDILPNRKVIPIQGHQIEYTGLSISQITRLMGRFPTFRALLSGEEIDMASIMSLSGDVIAAIIAAGCGMSEHPEGEARAQGLLLDDQLSLLSAILKETMPDGPSPLLARFNELMQIFNVSAVSPQEPPKAASQLNSREGSNISSLTVTPS